MHALVAERIGVHRDEEIGPRLPRELHAPSQSHVVVALPGEDRTHSLPGVDGLLQLARDGQDDILLVHPPAGDRTRVIPSMSRVDRDDDIPQAPGFPRRRVVLGELDSGIRRSRMEIDDEAVPVALVGAEHEASRAGAFLEIEHNPQAPILAGGAADAADQPVGP